MLEREDPDSAIIFCNLRTDTELIANVLNRNGLDAEMLNGDLPQKERERVMGKVKRGELKFMVATDIAARGIDISDLSHVINYSLPEDPSVYLHRVGRTGRIGKKGTAISLVSGAELVTLTALERNFGIQFEQRKLPTPDEAKSLWIERQMKELRDAMTAGAAFEAYLPLAQDLSAREDGTVELPIRTRYRINHAVALLDAVREGAGIAFQPCWMVKDLLERKELVRILPQWEGPPGRAGAQGAAARPRRPRSGAAQAAPGALRRVSQRSGGTALRAAAGRSHQAVRLAGVRAGLGQGRARVRSGGGGRPAPRDHSGRRPEAPLRLRPGAAGQRILVRRGERKAAPGPRAERRDRAAEETVMELAIRCGGLVKNYDRVTAVDGLDLAVRRGECFGLLGPNGAGKTTTVEILEGLLEPTSGKVEILGMRWDEDARVLRQRLGISLQETHLPDKLTVEEVLVLFRSFFDKGRPVDQVLDLVSLSDKRNSWTEKLSGGQKQRLAVACALVSDPELLFLDEPTTGLDPQSRRQLWEVVLGFKSMGRTVLLTTHYMDEAERLCDRVAVVDRGKVIALGTPAELIASLGAWSRRCGRKRRSTSASTTARSRGT